MFGQFTRQEIKEGLEVDLPMPEIVFNNLWIGPEINSIWYQVVNNIKATTNNTNVSMEDILVPFLLVLRYINNNPQGILVWSTEEGDQCCSLGFELNSKEKVECYLQQYMECSDELFLIVQEDSMPQGVWDILLK